LRAQNIEIAPRKKFPLGVLVKACMNDGKEARARLTAAQAEREEIEVARVKGELVSLADVTGILRRLIGPVREALVTFPQAYAARCNPADPPMAMAALTEGVDQMLRGWREESLPKVIDIDAPVEEKETK
jgi:hypothetical protein